MPVMVSVDILLTLRNMALDKLADRKAAKELDVVLEINLLGFRAERNYPDARFWKLAGEAGCKVLLGCDAHMPQDFLDKTAIEKAMAMVQQYGLTLLETVPLQNIG